MIFGSFPLYLTIPEALAGPVSLPLGLQYPLFRLVIIAAGLLVAGGLYGLITRTRLGLQIQAGAADREMIAVLGVNVSVLYTVIFAVGAGLAGLAGALVGTLQSVEVGMGEPVLITAFVVIVIGGIGSIQGTLVGAILVGLVQTLGAFLLPIWSDALLGAPDVGAVMSSMIIYILMAVVLLLRPKGLMGSVV